MNELASMLVPLDTRALPGWPVPPDPSIWHELGLFVGAPLVVILLVAVITRVHHAVKGNMGVPEVANQPVWVNGRRVEPSVQSDEARQSIQAGHAAAGEQMETDDAAGGAGARW